ncbi:hypothetical protein HK097_007161, partial [Rhizophlyctis rosea]
MTSEDQTLSEDHLLQPTNLTLCITAYPYTADKNDELTFAEGRIIRIVRKVGGGWWEGQLDQRVGWFPANHVEEYALTGDLEEQSQIGPFTNSPEELDQLRLRTIWLNNELYGFAQNRDVDHPDATQPHEVIQGSLRRVQAVQAVLGAEKQYMSILDRMLEEFVHSLQNEDWFPEKDHAIIFANLDELADAQHDLVASLEADLDSVGKAYWSKCERLSYIYGDYCSNLPRAITVVTKYGQDTLMAKFLQNTSASQSSPPILHLVSALHKPAQWMHRCISMLQDILSVTDVEHPDFRYLELAVEEVRGVMDRIEREKRVKESREIVRCLSRRVDGWEGPSLERYGNLVLEGNMKVHDAVRKRERTFYLLEKMLVVVRMDRSKSGDGVRYKLVECILMGSEVVLGVVDGAESENDVSNLSFSLTFLPDDLRTKTLTIAAFNIDQKRRWLAAIQHRLTFNPPLPRPTPTSSDTTRTSASGESHELKPRRKNWFKAFGEKIMKKRPSVGNLREVDVGDSVSVLGDKDEASGGIGGNGKFVTKILRRKETKERLKGGSVSVGGDSRGSGEGLANSMTTTEGDIIGSYSPVSASTPRLRITRHSNSQSGHSGLHGSSSPSEGTSSSRSSLSNGNGVKRASIASMRSRSSGSRCGSPPPPSALRGDGDGGGGGLLSVEPPPPMPPLPAIVVESLKRRAKSMDLVQVKGEDEGRVGIVRANSDGDVAVGGGGMAKIESGERTPLLRRGGQEEDGRGREVKVEVSPPGTPDSGLWVLGGKGDRLEGLKPIVTTGSSGQRTALQGGLRITTGITPAMRDELTKTKAHSPITPRLESLTPTDAGSDIRTRRAEVDGRGRSISASAPTSPRVEPFQVETATTLKRETVRPWIASSSPHQISSPTAIGSYVSPVEPVIDGRTRTPVARSQPASPKRKSSAAMLVGSVKGNLAGMFKRTKSSEAVSTLGMGGAGGGG